MGCTNGMMNRVIKKNRNTISRMNTDADVTTIGNDSILFLLPSRTVQADKVIRLHQIHETHCLTVTDAFFRLSAPEQYEMEEGKDAVVTDCRNVCIGVHTADCVPVLFYDLFIMPLVQPMLVGVVRCSVSHSTHFAR